MTRRCSHCSNNGHNSRTCPTTMTKGGGGGVKLFGVRLDTDHNPHHHHVGVGIGVGGVGMKKSASMGSLSHYYSSSSHNNSSTSPSSDHLSISVAADPVGYASDDPASCSSNCRAARAAAADRKKGTPWTEDEHRLFLLGLQKLGKGDWRGIARNFVISRTPTQVASHAQKYFIRQSNSTRRKRRSSLFDMVPTMPIDQQSFPGEPHGPSQMTEDKNINQLHTPTLSLDGNFGPMESTSQSTVPMESTSQSIPTVIEEMMPCSDDAAPVDPAFAPTYLPVLFPFITSNIPVREEVDMETSHHQVIKPTPVLPKQAVNVDELVCMSKLTIGPSGADRIEPSPLSLRLAGPSRQSAFHASQPVS